MENEKTPPENPENKEDASTDNKPVEQKHEKHHSEEKPHEETKNNDAKTHNEIFVKPVHKDKPEAEENETHPEESHLIENNERNRLIIAIVVTAIVAAILTIAISNYVQRPMALWQQTPINRQNNAAQRNAPADISSVNDTANINRQQQADGNSKTYDLALPDGGNVHFIFPTGWNIDDTGNDIVLASPDGNSTYKISKDQLASGGGIIFSSSSSGTNNAYSVNVGTSGNQTTVKVSDNPADLMMMNRNYQINTANSLLEMERMNRQMDDMFWRMRRF